MRSIQASVFLCNRKLRPYYIKTFRGDAYLAVRYIMLCIPHQGASKQNVRRIMEAGSQKRAPVYEALEQLKKRRVVPFDVPGLLFRIRLETICGWKRPLGTS